MIHIQFLLPHLSAHRIKWVAFGSPAMEKETSDVWSSVGELVRDLVWRNVLLLRGAQRLIQTGCDNDWPEKVEKRRRRDASAASGALIVFKAFCGFLVLLFVEFLFFFSFGQHLKMTAAFQELSDIKSKKNKWIKRSLLLTILRIKVRLVEWLQHFSA